MAQSHWDYYTMRARDEDRLAEAAWVPAVRARHLELAEAYRRELQKGVAYLNALGKDA